MFRRFIDRALNVVLALELVALIAIGARAVQHHERTAPVETAKSAEWAGHYYGHVGDVGGFAETNRTVSDGDILPAVGATSCWTTEHTWNNETITDALLNTHLRDNANCLKTDINSDGTITRVKRLSTNTTNVGNVGGGEDDLMTYSLGAGTLATDGQVARFFFTFSTAGNSNTKTIKLYFGATAVTIMNAAVNGQVMNAEMRIIRTGAATQLLVVNVNQGNNGNTVGAVGTTAAETLSGAITVKATGQSGASATNDVIQSLFIAYFEN